SPNRSLKPSVIRRRTLRRARCSARQWPTINRSIRTPQPLRKANGRMTSAAPAPFMKSITRS
ncbi:spermidine/putrescine-binding periplasmic protein, partial [Klebsiella pneumoniae]